MTKKARFYKKASVTSLSFPGILIKQSGFCDLVAGSGVFRLDVLCLVLLVGIPKVYSLDLAFFWGHCFPPLLIWYPLSYYQLETSRFPTQALSPWLHLSLKIEQSIWRMEQSISNIVVGSPVQLWKTPWQAHWSPKNQGMLSSDESVICSLYLYICLFFVYCIELAQFDKKLSIQRSLRNQTG